MQMNRIEIAGYLSKKPEIRYLPSGTPVANARLGQSYRYQDSSQKWNEHTNWHSLSFYGDLANVAINFEKGENLYVEGTIEQREFTRPQVERLRAALHLARQQVEREIADRQPRRLGGTGGAPDQRLDAREQLGKGERLGQVIVAAGLQAPNAIVHRPPGAEDQDRRRDAARAQRVDERQPVHARQHDVHDGDVERCRQRPLETGPAVRRHLDDKPGFAQPLLNEPRNGRIVFDEQDPHEVSLPASDLRS